MNFTVDRDALFHLIEGCRKGIIVGRQTVPILSTIRLQAVGDELTGQSTNLDMEYRARVPAENHGDETAVCVGARMLGNVLKEFPRERIEIFLKEGKINPTMVMRCGPIVLSIDTLPGADFPEIAERTSGLSHRFSMSAQQVYWMVDRTFWAASDEETRYYLNGMFLESVAAEPGYTPPEGEALRAVTTDGHRLVYVEFDPPPEGAGKDIKLIVPRAALSKVKQMTHRVGGDFDLTLWNVEGSTAGRIAFEHEGMRLLTKTIDGTFPDYRRVIPTTNEHRLEFSRTAMLATAKRIQALFAALPARERHKAMRWRLYEDRIDVEAEHHDAGTYRETVRCEFGGPEMAVGLNCGYAIDMLAHMDGDTIIAKISDPSSPLLFRSADPDHPTPLCVQMPMRV